MTRTRQVSESVVVAAAPERIFALLADPRRHAEFDGSGTIRSVITGPERLELGARFGMRMRHGVPYRVSNIVVEFEQDRRIAWRHFGRHIWRYELEPVDGGTKVTETFDWRTTPLRRIFDVTSVPRSNAKAITASLRRLKDLLEHGGGGTGGEST